MPDAFRSTRRAGATLALVFGCLVGASAQTGETLSLERALELARQRNGTIRAAELDVESARQRVTQANAAFYPQITPQYQYNDIRRERDRASFAQSGDVGLIRGSWRLLDSGERDFSVRSSRRALESTRFTGRQTLRTTLFSVTQQYYDALRAQELKRVADSQVARAETILKQTQARIAVKDAAPIEELQANADFQNARVQSLNARNRVTNAAATLKASIGLDTNEPLPTLERVDQTTVAEIPSDLRVLVNEGISNRPDLLSRRRSIESQRLSQRRADREAGISFGVDLFDDYQVTPDRLNDRTFSFLLSYPLFDGGRRRAIVRELGANIQADRLALAQAERSAQAEIEAAYAEVTTNVERLNAAQIALDAARRNFEAATGSRQAGAADLLQVLTAQVSLVTAESNYIEAVYDTRIAEARLRLVTGRPVPGEIVSGATTP